MKPKRIAVNTRLLLPGKLEGIGRFTHEIFQRLTTLMPEHEFFFLFDRPYDPAFLYSDNVHPVVLGPPTRHPVLWKLWFDVQLPRFFRKQQIDLFISPDGFLSSRTSITQIAVMHDLNFIRRPENLRPSHRSYYLRNFPRFARLSDPLITVSEFSRNDIIEEFSIDPDRIRVIYNGVSEHFHLLDEGSDEDLFEEFPFFLFVGAFNPRKNITGLLKAFDRYKELGGTAHLCLAGERMFLNKEMRETFEQLRHADQVHFFGRASDRELRLLYGHTLGLILPSFEEGFGIPILEAMRCGTAVICSNRTAMPEVAGDAALLIDPERAEQISDAMLRLERDVELRSDLVEKGLKRVENFSWDRSASDLKMILLEKLSGS